MSHVPFPLHAKLYIIKVYRHVESYPVPYLRIICITCILPRPRAGGGAWAGVSHSELRSVSDVRLYGFMKSKCEIMGGFKFQ